MSNKLLVCGDVHLYDRQISSRVDSSVQTVLTKFKFVLDTAKEEGADVVFCGDFFHAPIRDFMFANTVFSYLLDAKNNGVGVYTLVGNHSGDCDGKNWVTYTGTLLGLMRSAGVLNTVSPSSAIAFIHAYSWPLEHQTVNPGVEVVFAHYFINSGPPNETLVLPFAQLKSYFPNMKLLITGHDHILAGPVVVDGVTCYNAGTLFRTSSDQEKSIPHLFLLDTQDWTVKRIIPVPCQIKVFQVSASKVSEKEISKQVSDFMESLQKISVSADSISAYVRQFLASVEGETGRLLLERLIQGGL